MHIQSFTHNIFLNIIKNLPTHMVYEKKIDKWVITVSMIYK